MKTRPRCFPDGGSHSTLCIPSLPPGAPTPMNDSSDSPSLSYRDAGVDIDAGNQLVDRLKKVTAATRRPEVMGGIGGFGALVEIPEGYHRPVLVSGTDGVGTKLRLAMMADRHDTIGIDLVACAATILRSWEPSPCCS